MDGVGISAKQRESLFELYVPDPNSRQLTGLGLGLYLSGANYQSSRWLHRRRNHSRRWLDFLVFATCCQLGRSIFLNSLIFNLKSKMV